MNEAPDSFQLCDEVKRLSGLTARDETTLHELADSIVPALDGVTDRLFARLGAVPRAAEAIEGRAESLKETHRAWLRSLFTRSLDADYAHWVYGIGAAIVRLGMPVEVVTASMSMVLRELLLLVGAAALDPETKTRAGAAIGSACAFSQLIMQRSYGVGGPASEAARVQMIADISRELFDRMATFYKGRTSTSQAITVAARVDRRPRRRGRYGTRIEFNQCRRRMPPGYA